MQMRTKSSSQDPSEAKTRSRTQVTRLSLQCSLHFTWMQRNYPELTMSYSIISSPFSWVLPCGMLLHHLFRKQRNQQKLDLQQLPFSILQTRLPWSISRFQCDVPEERWEDSSTAPSRNDSRAAGANCKDFPVNLTVFLQFSLKSMCLTSMEAQSERVADDRRGKSVHKDF